VAVDRSIEHSRYVVLPAADRDLDEQAEYLVQVGTLETGLRFLDAVDITFSFLAGNPEIGTLRKSKIPALAEVRFWPVRGFEKHLIFYRPTANGVEIVRVLHGRRDLESLLSF
jgi:toxin ParE1/3/4